MEHSTSDPTIRQSVMQRIHDGRARMRPAWHFGVRAVLWALGIVVLLAITMALISFVVFAMRQTGAMSAPAFGFRGFVPLLAGIPWLPVAICALFVLSVEVVARHFAFAYRRPLVISLSVIIGLSIVGGALFARTPMHRRLFDRASQGRLPIAGPLYQRYGLGAEGAIHPGVIASIQGDVVTLTNRRGIAVTVYITDATDVAEGILAIGMPVIVLGERDGASISALEIIPAPDDMLWGSPASGGMPMRMHRSSPGL